MDPKPCFYCNKIGISNLENDIEEIKWPNLTKKQQEKKLKAKATQDEVRQL